MNLIVGESFEAVFAVIDFKQATVTLMDGTGTPVELEIKIGEGNLTYTERKPRKYTLNRGSLDEVVNDDDAPVELSFDAVWEYMSSLGGATGIEGTVIDFLKKQGAYSANTSTDTDTCRPYAVDVVVDYTPDCATAISPNETITFPDFRYEEIAGDIGAGSFAISGQCNVTEPVPLRYT